MSTENTADSVDPQGAAETANREAAQGADASAHATAPAATPVESTQSTQPTEPLPPTPGVSPAASSSPTWAPPAAGTHHPQSPYAQLTPGPS